MTQVAPVTFNGTSDNRKTAETAAVGIGAAGATSAYASRKAVSNGVWSTVGSTASRATQFTQKTADIMVTTSKSTSWFKKLAASFRLKKAAYLEDFTRLATKVKNMKVVGAVLNNPIARKAGAAFSGVLAFFVLVPSALKMVEVAEQISSR